jgi:hypothetical protein
MKISNFLLSALMVIAVIVSNSASAQTVSIPRLTVIAQQCDEVFVTYQGVTGFSYGWENICTDVWGYVDENNNVVPPPPPEGSENNGAAETYKPNTLSTDRRFCIRSNDTCDGWFLSASSRCAVIFNGYQAISCATDASNQRNNSCRSQRASNTC